MSDLRSPLIAEASRQLLRDIEKHPNLSCSELLALRPQFYLGKYQKAAQNRYNYLISLKTGTKAASYNKLSDRLGNKDELASLEDSQFAPPSRKAPTKGTPNRVQPPRTVTSASFNSPPPAARSRPASGTPVFSPSKKMNYPGSTFPEGTRNMFSTIEEAIEYADEVIDLADFHKNEED